MKRNYLMKRVQSLDNDQMGMMICRFMVIFPDSNIFLNKILCMDIGY